MSIALRASITHGPFGLNCNRAGRTLPQFNFTLTIEGKHTGLLMLDGDRFALAPKGEIPPGLPRLGDPEQWERV